MVKLGSISKLGEDTICGIFGVISFEKMKEWQKRKDVISQAFVTGTLRGTDSSGLFAVPHNDRKEELILYKKAMAGYDFVSMPKVGAILNNMDYYKFFIGHHRAATFGKVNNANAHPFNIEHITLVHNGTMQSMSGYHAAHTKYNVDSELLAHVIAEQGYEKALSELKGPAAIVWYDAKEDTLSLYRNEDRPLYYCKEKEKENLYIASELNMIRWLAVRNGIEIETAYEVKANTVCTFKEGIKPISIVEIKPPVKALPPVYDYRHEYGDGEFSPQGGWKNKRKLQKLTTNEVFEKAKVTIDQIIEFTHEGMEFPSKHSKHGTVYGSMVASPWNEVVAHGIDPKKIQGATMLKGRVVGATMGEYGIVSLIVVNVELSNEKLLDGPNGKKITVKEFNEAVKYGCASCQCDLLPIQGTVGSWLQDGSPLCTTCVSTNNQMQKPH